MAETTQNKKTYKYGEREYYEDEFLKLHGAQLENYIDYARKRGQFDDAAIAQLRSAVNNRINAITSGQVFRGDGSLDTDQVNNITIKTGKRGKTSVNQDITEWAKYYVNTLVNNLSPVAAQKEEDVKSNNWDLSQHGYGAHLKKSGYNAQEIFENNDKQNPNEPDAARSFEERDAFNLKQLTAFRDHLIKQNYTFTNDDDTYNDDYMEKLNNFINNYSSYNVTDKAAMMRYLGAGDDWVTSITSDRWDLSKTPAQTAEEKKAKQEEEQQQQATRQKATYLKEWEDYAYSNRRAANPVQYLPYDYSNHKFGKNVNPSFQAWYGDLSKKEQLNYGTYLGAYPDRNPAVNANWNRAWASYMNSLKGGPAYTDKNLGILLQGAFENQNHRFTDLGNGTYLINDSVTETGQGTTYDPTSGYVRSVFLGDLAANNESVKKLYQQLGYDYINKKYNTNYEDRTYVFAEGGSINKYQAGGDVAFDWRPSSSFYSEKGKKENVSGNIQKARDNYMNSDNESELNEATGWNAAAKWRLSYALSDLGSAIASFFPGYGTAGAAVASAYSTTGNFITDLADDAVTTGQAFKNLGLNVGMDLIGLIPGGGSSTKLGKILKGLKSTVPLIMATPGVVSMLANSPEIAESWKKAFDGSPENGGSKLDYQDYMNILQVLNVAAAGVNIGTNKYRSKQNSVKSNKHIAVEVTDGSGNKKALVLDGDDVAKFKKANSEGKAQEFINGLAGGKDLTIVPTKERNSLLHTGDDNKTHLQNPFKKHDTKTAVTYEIKYDARKGKLYADTGDSWKSPSDYFDDNLISSSKSKSEAQWNRIVSQLETKAKRYGVNTKKYEKILDKANTRKADTETSLTKLQEDIAFITTNKDVQQQILSYIETQRSGTLRQDAEAAIASARDKIAAKTSEKNGIKSKSKLATIDAEIAAIEETIEPYETYLSGTSDESLSAAQKAVSDSDAKLSDLQIEANKLQALLDKLNPSIQKLERRIGTHSPSFTRRLNMHPVTRSKFGKDAVTKDVYTVGKSVTEQDLLNAGWYKQGGSIDITKLNKFLNYAKR